MSCKWCKQCITIKKVELKVEKSWYTGVVLITKLDQFFTKYKSIFKLLRKHQILVTLPL